MQVVLVAWLALLTPASLCIARPRLLLDDATVVLQGSDATSRTVARPLKGKFLHITDIHPDPFYKVYSSTEGDKACHRGTGPAGYYGAETSDCDSPLSLVDATFSWINENLRDEIDFVIWTGDSARHDNDENLPRNDSAIVSLNELMVKKFFEVFGKNDPEDDDDPTNDFLIPIVPTFGNNDIFPHNTFSEGPNKWTKTYLDVWRQFIPEEQRHQFARGGWFSVEVIPNKLAVISLNTLYFFTSNAAVDGCALKSEPGYEHLEWLRIQLRILRERGMKAIIMGHVAPARVDSKTSWDETCWQKYALWMHEYRDVVVTSLYGHMNIEHFMIQDFKDVKGHVKKGFMYDDERVSRREIGANEPEPSIQAATDYLSDLRSTFAKLPDIITGSSLDEDEYNRPGAPWMQRVLSLFRPAPPKREKAPKPFKNIGGPFGERYSLSFVSASVVPNYLPTLRVFSYNISGLETTLSREEQSLSASLVEASSVKEDESSQEQDEDEDEDEDATSGPQIGPNKSPRKKPTPKPKPKKPQPKRHKFKLPLPPSKASPPGPAYSPQTLSLLGYTQYYANLSWINNDFTHDNETGRRRAPSSVTAEDSDEDSSVEAEKWNKGKHHGKVPKHSQPRPKKFKFRVEYDTRSDSKGYGLEDLTVRSLLRLAKRMAAERGAFPAGAELENEEAEMQSDEIEDEQGEDDLQEEAVETTDVDMSKKKKKHKKPKINKAWYTFVKRAFVSTMDPTELAQFVSDGKRPRRKELAAEQEQMKLEM